MKLHNECNSCLSPATTTEGVREVSTQTEGSDQPIKNEFGRVVELKGTTKLQSNHDICYRLAAKLSQEGDNLKAENEFAWERLHNMVQVNKNLKSALCKADTSLKNAIHELQTKQKEHDAWKKQFLALDDFKTKHVEKIQEEKEELKRRVDILTKLNNMKHRIIAKFCETSLNCQEEVKEAKSGDL